MEHLIALTHKEYKELESLKVEVAALKKELEKEKENKNVYLFLRTSLANWNKYEGKAVRFGVIDYSVDSVPATNVDMPMLKNVINSCIEYLLFNRRDSYILTREGIDEALDNIEKQRKLLDKHRESVNLEEKRLNDKLANLPKWLKWFLQR